MWDVSKVQEKEKARSRRGVVSLRYDDWISTKDYGELGCIESLGWLDPSPFMNIPRVLVRTLQATSGTLLPSTRAAPIILVRDK